MNYIDRKALDSYLVTKNIVHKHEENWYFWDDTYTSIKGPFFTKKEALEECRKYAKNPQTTKYS